jgi:hypothetical protein
MKRFVYGIFEWPGKNKGLTPPPRSFMPISATLTAWDKLALEVIREYGANEFIGKAYFMGAFNAWTPVEPSSVGNLEWFIWYKRLSPAMREHAKGYYFDMEGSGHWAVLHFRNESDESGPYLAIALRYVQ